MYDFNRNDIALNLINESKNFSVSMKIMTRGIGPNCLVLKWPEKNQLLIPGALYIMRNTNTR